MSLNNLSSRAIIGEYYARAEEALDRAYINAISSEFETNQETETYRWLGATPAMREWAEGRQAKGLRDQSISATSTQFEATLEIPVKDIRRDKTDQIMVRVGEFAQRATQHWAKLLSTLIEDGEDTACYDGQYFFDDDHSEGDSGTQTNDLDSGDYGSLDVADPSAPTATEMADIIVDVVSHFYDIVDDQGEPMNEDAREFLIMVPNAQILAPTVKAIKSNRLDTGSGTRDNPVTALSGTMPQPISVQAVLNPRLSWTSKIAVFRTDARMKALIRQTETGTGPEIEVVGAGSEHEFKHKTWLLGIDTWRAVQYGYWQYSMLATMS